MKTHDKLIKETQLLENQQPDPNKQGFQRPPELLEHLEMMQKQLKPPPPISLVNIRYHDLKTQCLAALSKNTSISSKIVEELSVQEVESVLAEWVSSSSNSGATVQSLIEDHKNFCALVLWWMSIENRLVYVNGKIDLTEPASTIFTKLLSHNISLPVLQLSLGLLSDDDIANAMEYFCDYYKIEDYIRVQTHSSDNARKKSITSIANDSVDIFVDAIKNLDYANYSTISSKVLATACMATEHCIKHYGNKIPISTITDYKMVSYLHNYFIGNVDQKTSMLFTYHAYAKLFGSTVGLLAILRFVTIIRLQTLDQGIAVELASVATRVATDKRLCSFTWGAMQSPCYIPCTAEEAAIMSQDFFTSEPFQMSKFDRLGKEEQIALVKQALQLLANQRPIPDELAVQFSPRIMRRFLDMVQQLQTEGMIWPHASAADRLNRMNVLIGQYDVEREKKAVNPFYKTPPPPVSAQQPLNFAQDSANDQGRILFLRDLAYLFGYDDYASMSTFPKDVRETGALLIAITLSNTPEIQKRTMLTTAVYEKTVRPPKESEKFIDNVLAMGNPAKRAASPPSSPVSQQKQSSFLFKLKLIALVCVIIYLIVKANS